MKIENSKIIFFWVSIQEWDHIMKKNVMQFCHTQEIPGRFVASRLYANARERDSAGGILWRKGYLLTSDESKKKNAIRSRSSQQVSLERSFHNYEIASLKDPLQVDSLYFSSSPCHPFISFTSFPFAPFPSTLFLLLGRHHHLKIGNALPLPSIPIKSTMSLPAIILTPASAIPDNFIHWNSREPIAPIIM